MYRQGDENDRWASGLNQVTAEQFRSQRGSTPPNSYSQQPVPAQLRPINPAQSIPPPPMSTFAPRSTIDQQPGQFTPSMPPPPMSTAQLKLTGSQYHQGIPPPPPPPPPPSSSAYIPSYQSTSTAYNSGPSYPSTQYSSMSSSTPLPPPPPASAAASLTSWQTQQQNRPATSQLPAASQPPISQSTQQERPSSSSPSSPGKRSSNRIDPSQLPRPPRLQSDIIFHTRTSSIRKVPPSANAGFMSVDTGNCSPRFMRVTTCAPATSSTLLSKTSVPFAVIATPFAETQNGEEKVPVVDYRAPPPRCSRCSGYINVNVTWTNEGNKWQCNLCGMSNLVPSWYYCSLDGSAQRLDRSDRPELSKGSVDFVATPEYCSRPIQDALYVFAIDVSSYAVSSGCTAAAINAVRNALVCLPGSGCRAGVITFNSRIQFYTVNENDAESVRMFVADSEDPFSPLPQSSWLLPVETKFTALNLLLDRILEFIPQLLSEEPSVGVRQSSATSSPAAGGGSRNMFSPEVVSASCPVAAISATQQALEKSGGRLYLMTTSHSKVGFGKVRIREGLGLYGADAEVCLYGNVETLVAMNKAITEKDSMARFIHLADACAAAMLCVTMIVCSEGDEFKDIALLSEPCERTGGCCHFMSGSMLVEDNSMRLSNQLSRLVGIIAASDACVKIRTSVGVQVSSVISSGTFRKVEEELEFAGMNTTTTLCTLLRHDSTLKDDEYVYIQLAVLYTTPNKQRLIRVHNMCLSATSDATILFRYLDLEAVASCLVKQSLDKALTNALSSPSEAGPRTFLYESTLRMLLNYRLVCSPDAPKGQLILPESLKLLPLLVLGALKHPALLENSTADTTSNQYPRLVVRAPERAYELRRLRSLSIRELMNALYPRLFVLNVMFDDDDFSAFTHQDVDAGEDYLVSQLPRVMCASSEILESDGVYLLDDGCKLWLYVGRNVPQASLYEWFGTHPGERPSHVQFRTNISASACKMLSAVEILRFSSTLKQELCVVWGDNTGALEFTRFTMRLIEDNFRGDSSYVNFLIKLHSKIQTKLP